MRQSHGDSNEIMGHSANDHGENELLSTHLRSVALRCGKFAGSFGCEDEGRACGLLHDLGKMGPVGQKRLRGIGRGVDHRSYGAHRLLDFFQHDGVAAALCVLAHHHGWGVWLQTWSGYKKLITYVV